jgi:hypothetical protein
MVDFIDFGCDIGKSIRWAQTTFGGETHLGIDIKEADVQGAIKNGYTAIVGDLTDDALVLPNARYVTMLHFLEHLKSEEAVEKVIKKAIDVASEFIFIKVPYFDRMDYLKRLGFKLTWTDWIGHPTLITSDMLVRIMHKFGFGSTRYDLGYLDPVYTSESKEIIPYNAPVDSIVYDTAMGEKEYTEFKDIYRETYLLININCPSPKWNELKQIFNQSGKITIKNLPIIHYLRLIQNNSPFSFSRFGDGEVLAINNPDFFKNQPTFHYGTWIQNCSDALMSIFIHNYDYYHGFLYGTFWNRGPHRGNEFVEFLQKVCPDTTFYNGEVWQDLSFQDGIEQITGAINPYKPVFIGGKHLANIQYLNGITDMQLIPVDDWNAYDEHDYIHAEILKKFDEGSRMFCFSASIVSKVLIDELFPIIGDKAFLIDTGSVFDPYCGKLSRSNMVTVGFKKFQPYTKMKLL